MIRTIAMTSLFALIASVGGCSDYREDTRSTVRNETITSRSPGATAMFRQGDPTISKFFDSAYAYAVFPEISKGAAGIGAANGSGVVYQGSAIAGFSEMTQITVGAQIGGQTYRMVVFFQDARAFDRFKSGNLEFSANASAVIVKSGAAAANDYRDGIAVYVQPIAGAMAEAAIGGQRFTFRSMGAGGATRTTTDGPLVKVATTNVKTTPTTSTTTKTTTGSGTMPTASTTVTTAGPAR
ncbi:MAG: hypothetical protein K2X97_12620 [Mycobacteriaceae bacterium]|nr:hypothetical protein [Mycobacteriaceae bacterium]